MTMRGRRTAAPAPAAPLAEALASAGTELVFGVPGGGSNLDVIGAAEAAGCRFVLAHGETAAGIMAGAASFGAGDIARHASGALGVASFATSPLRGPAAQAAVKGVGKGLLLGGAALAGGVGAAYGAMRSAFHGKPAAPAPQKPAATQAAMVQASPHVASAVAVNRTGSRGPVFEGEFVEPTAAVQRRSSAPSGARAADPALPYRPRALPATSSALPAGNSSSS